ncbi:MAG: D-alanyl-D-alanine carboxypeptidase family protein [Patescibacteria group bacterium]
MKHLGHGSHGLPLPAVATGLVVALFAGASVYAQVRLYTLTTTVARLNSELASTTAVVLASGTKLATEISEVRQQATGLSQTLSATEQQVQNTRQSVEAVQTQVGGFQQTVGQISGTVTTLEKLSKTDPELLQKYSKVFFLNEHYNPPRLTEISNAYLYSEKEPESIHATVWPYLQMMMDASKRDNASLFVKSGFRSFDEQKSLKGAYSVTYGVGTANQFSADQGYSEHQLGTTIDFISTGQNGQLNGFEKTTAYAWLLNRAHLYGFVLSYPPNNKFYVFEPWHWRFVGIKLATYLFTQQKHFYDLDQREIDSYLVNVFE